MLCSTIFLQVRRGGPAKVRNHGSLFLSLKKGWREVTTLRRAAQLAGPLHRLGTLEKSFTRFRILPQTRVRGTLSSKILPKCPRRRSRPFRIGEDRKLDI